jgi:tetratricopeptide (TPR) repeat protein
MYRMHISICHAPADEPICQQLASALDAAGAEVWYTNYGESTLQQKMANIIAYSHEISLILLSPDFFETPWCQKLTKSIQYVNRWDVSRLIVPIVVSTLSNYTLTDSWNWLLPLPRIEAGPGEPLDDMSLIQQVLEALALNSTSPQLASTVPAVIWRHVCALRAQRRYEDALIPARQLAQQSPNIETQLMLMELYYELRKIEEASILADEVIADYPNDVRLLNMLGMIRAYQHRYGEAIKLFVRASLGDQEFPYPALNASMAQFVVDRREKGLLMADNNTKRFPFIGMTWIYRAYMLSVSGRDSESLRDIDEALKIMPYAHETWKVRADVLVKTQRYKEALVACDRGLAEAPATTNRIGLLLTRAKALSQMKHYQEALAAYDHILFQYPHLWKPLYARGKVLYALHREKEALESVNQAMHFAPDGAARNRVALFQACLLYIHKDYVKAEKVLNKLLVGDSQNALLHRAHADVLRSMHRYSDAVKEYNYVLSLDEHEIQAWLGLGITEYAQKHCEKALDHFEKVIALQSNMIAAWRWKMLILRSLKRYDEANQAEEHLHLLEKSNVLHPTSA